MEVEVGNQKVKPMTSTMALHQDKSVSSICRLCFMERERLELIFDGDSRYLKEWIEKLTSLKVVHVPNAPASLCSECKSTLEAFDAFREMCLTNDLVFKDTFCQDNRCEELRASQIKIESDESQQSMNSLIKREVLDERDEYDATPTEQLIDVHETKPMDVDATINADVHPVIEVSKTVVQEPLTIRAILSDLCKYPCKICKDKTSKLHTLTHQDSQLFRCFVCSEEFDRYINVSKHTYRLHKEEETRVSTKTGAIEADNALIEFETDSSNSASAPITMASYESIPSETTKLISAESEDYSDEEDYDHIDEEMRQRKRIRCHLNNQEGTTSKDIDNRKLLHMCKICNKISSKLHVMTHKADGSFLCYICGQVYDKILDIKEHIKRHWNNGQKDVENLIEIASTPASSEIVAETCEIKVEEPTLGLDSSVAEEEGEAKLPPTEKSDEDEATDPCWYKCKICHIKAPKMHIVTHKAIGEYQCPVCERQFPKFYNVNSHIKTHSNKAQAIKPPIVPKIIRRPPPPTPTKKYKLVRVYPK